MSKKANKTSSFEEVEDDEGVAGVGHNRPGGLAADKLKSVVKRIEKLEEENSAIAADIRDVYQEAKANGLDTKMIRAIVKLRTIEAGERDEYFLLLDTYARVFGFSVLDLESE